MMRCTLEREAGQENFQLSEGERFCARAAGLPERMTRQIRARTRTHAHAHIRDVSRGTTYLVGDQRAAL